VNQILLAIHGVFILENLDLARDKGVHEFALMVQATKKVCYVESVAPPNHAGIEIGQSWLRSSSVKCEHIRSTANRSYDDLSDSTESRPISTTMTG
jgi:hypothetical protein